MQKRLKMKDEYCPKCKKKLSLRFVGLLKNVYYCTSCAEHYVIEKEMK